jgi:hypothetical protein
MWFYKSGHGKGEPGPETGTGSQPDTSALPSVRAMLVGPSGSGKTMQLAAMHYVMSGGDGHQDGIVRVKAADDETRRGLGDMATRIMDSDPRLPTGTPNTYEWNFDIEARGPGLDLVPLLRLMYLDYAGELGLETFTVHEGDATASAPSPAMLRFQSAIAGHDVLLGVLDGAKIAQALAEDVLPDRLDQEIWQTLLLVSEGRQKIIHLVLTKWDELVKHDISLARVVEYLHHYPGFRGLCGMRPPGQLRLIPVSALGVPPYLDIGHNGVTRLSRRGWDPFNPGLPLACGIADIVAADLVRMDEATSSKKQKVLPIQPSHVFWGILVGLGLVVVASHPVHLATAAIAGKAVGIGLEVPVGAISEVFWSAVRHDGPQAERAQRLLELRGQGTQPARRAATANLLAYCLQQSCELTRQFPASMLTLPGR